MECPICLEEFSSHEVGSSIWGCLTCRTSIHLVCIIRWYEFKEREEWKCPCCSFPYTEQPMVQIVTKVSSQAESSQQECLAGPTVSVGPPLAAQLAVREDIIRCYCERTFLYLPSETKSVTCPYPCNRPRTCDHVPSHNCHVSGKCPPCVELVMKECAGYPSINHCRLLVHCFKTQVRCGTNCHKQLPCGHLCISSCHYGECKTCSTICGKKLPNCEHCCELPCHPTIQCQSKPCERLVTSYCACKKYKKLIRCSDVPSVLLCKPQICKEMPKYGRELLAYKSLFPKHIIYFENILSHLLTEAVKRSNGSQSFLFTDSCLFLNIFSELAKYYNIICEMIYYDNGEKIRIDVVPQSKSPAVLLSTVSPVAIFEHALYVDNICDINAFRANITSACNRIGVVVEGKMGFWLFPGSGDCLLFLQDPSTFRLLAFGNQFPRLCRFHTCEKPQLVPAKQKKKKKVKVKFIRERPTSSLSLSNSFISLAT